MAQIGAGLAAVYPGVVAGRMGEANALLAEMQAQQAQESQQADVLRGNALMHLFGGPGGGQPPAGPMPQSAGFSPPPDTSAANWGGGVPTAPMQAPGVPRPPGLIPNMPPMPGQSSAPPGGPMPGAGGPPPMAGGPTPTPSPPYPLGPKGINGAPDIAPPGAPAPSTTGQGPPAAAQPVARGNQMEGAETPLRGMGEQNGQPTFFGGRPQGPLTWQTIGQAIAKANPGAPPQLIAKAIDRFAPMMTQESQMQWHILKMQQDEKLVKLREGGKDTRSERRETNLNDRASFMRDLRREEIASKDKRAEVSNETRLATAGLSAETRKLIADAHESGADQRLLTTLRARDDWKKLDVESKREITDMIIEGQKEREGVRQEGANTRSQATIAGANERNQNTVAGANQRNTATNDRALQVSRERNEMARWLADGKPITSTQERLSEKAGRYDSASKTIDDAISDVAKGHKEGKNVVGLGGAIRGVYEIANNIGGWSDDTRRAAFVQKIELLRATLPRLLTQSAISNKDERARMQQILQGLEKGSTKQATFKDLVYLKEKLGELAPKIKANANQGDMRNSRQAPAADTGDAAPKLAPMTPAAKAAMDAALAGGHSRADVEKMVRDRGYDPASGVTAEPEPAAPAGPAKNGYGRANVTTADEHEEFDKFMEKMADISSKVNIKAFNDWLKTAPDGDIEDRRTKRVRPRATFREAEPAENGYGVAR